MQRGAGWACRGAAEVGRGRADNERRRGLRESPTVQKLSGSGAGSGPGIILSSSLHELAFGLLAIPSSLCHLCAVGTAGRALWACLQGGRDAAEGARGGWADSSTQWRPWGGSRRRGWGSSPRKGLQEEPARRFNCPSGEEMQ